MSAELYDLRAKVTVETHCALAAHSRANDVEVSEVVRDVLHQWALRQIHGARMLQLCLKAKGVSGTVAGTSGNRGEPLDWSAGQ